MLFIIRKVDNCEGRYWYRWLCSSRWCRGCAVVKQLEGVNGMTSTAITTPALIITLGTTSSMAASEVFAHLMSLSQDDRDSVSLVMIDTDLSRPQIQDFLDVHGGAFNVSKAQIAVPSGIDYAQLPPNWEHTYIPPFRPHYHDYGAGGLRNNGHVALCYHRDDVETSIQDALGKIYRLGTRENEKRALAVQVYVVAFLGGGTGSGIVSDIAVMVRQMLTSEQKNQRLILFAILPGDTLPGVNPNEESWRKSNSTAALVEVMATGMAAQTAPNGLYSKYLLGKEYRVAPGPIFNEVYLFGRTNMNSVEDTARIVGLDIFQRITDASGIGDVERSKAPDRQVLTSVDDENLPTNFSASCPFEVRFPVDETTEAFAEVATSYMLLSPVFIGQRPSYPTPTEAERNVWVQKWRGVAARVTVASGQNDLTISRPAEFTAGQFEDATPQKRAILWQQLIRGLGATNAEIARVMDRMRTLEEARIADVTTTEKRETPLARSMQGRKILHYEALLAEYQAALDDLNQRRPRASSPSRPNELERKLDHGLRLPQFLEDLLPDILNPDIPAEVADAYNDVVDANYAGTRSTALITLVTALLARVNELLKAEGEWMANTHNDERSAELRRRGYARMAWQGRLARPHPHQRHVFDLTAFKGKANEKRLQFLPAMEGVFRMATTRDANMTLGNCLRRDSFDMASEMERLAPNCIAFINASRRDDDMNEKNRGLDEEHANQVPEKVLQFFRKYYQDWLDGSNQEQLVGQNLFDLLAIGIAAEEPASLPVARRRTQSYLERHLIHIKGILGELVTYEPGLWLNGSSKLLATLYLGVNFRVQQGEEAVLADAIKAVGSMTTRVNLMPYFFDRDLHRLQVNYGQHGISIRTIPDFYSETNSAMEQYLNHQSAWFSDGQPGHYGMNNGPVHSSTEMERLAWSPDAWGARQGSLIHRVCRRPMRLVNAPAWAQRPAGGAPGGAGGPQNPQGPQGPQGPQVPYGGGGQPGGQPGGHGAYGAGGAQAGYGPPNQPYNQSPQGGPYADGQQPPYAGWGPNPNNGGDTL